MHTTFDSIEDLNSKTRQWIEDEYNHQYHSGIQMKPIDRFNIDQRRIQFLTDDEFTAEVFYLEEERKVSKTNVFSICSMRFECPVDLREKRIQVRYDRNRDDMFIVFFDGKRMGRATPLNLTRNADAVRFNSKKGAHS